MSSPEDAQDAPDTQDAEPQTQPDELDLMIASWRQAQSEPRSTLAPTVAAFHFLLQQRTGHGFASGPNAAGEMKCLCPLHKEERPSASFNIHNGLLYCHVEGIGGDLAWLVSKLEGLSYKQARRRVTELVANHPTTGTPETSQMFTGVPRGVDKPDEMCYSPFRGPSSSLLQLVSNYSIDSIRKEFAPAVYRVLEDHGIPSPEQASKDLGLGISDGDRVVWPIFVAGADGQPKLVNVKYYNPHHKQSREPGYDGFRWPKWQHLGERYGGNPRVLWSPDIHWDSHSQVVVCAGEWDCLRAHAAGLHAVTGTSGEGFFDPAWGSRFRGKDVVICYDNDDTGTKGAAKARAIIEPYAASVRVVIPNGRPDTPRGYDLCDYLKEGRPLAELISFPEVVATAPADEADDAGDEAAEATVPAPATGSTAAEPDQWAVTVETAISELRELSSTGETEAKAEVATRILREMAKRKMNAADELYIKQIASASKIPVDACRAIVRDARREREDVRVPAPTLEEPTPPGRVAQVYNHEAKTISYGMWLPTKGSAGAVGGGWDTLAPFTVTATLDPQAPIRFSPLDAEERGLPSRPSSVLWNTSDKPYNLFQFAEGRVLSADIQTAVIADTIRAEFDTYFEFKLPEYVDLLIYWIMHTYMFVAFDSTGYLSITGIKGSGKSSLFQLLKALCFRGASSANMSEAALFRRVETDQPTLFLDEAEPLRAGKGGANAEDPILQILRSGYQRGSAVSRCEGENFEVREFSVYCPKAMAAMGRFEGALEDRCIPIHTIKKQDRNKQVFIPSEAEERWQLIQNRLFCWALTHCNEVTDARNKVLADEGVRRTLADRTLETWLPMLSVARMASDAQYAAAKHAAEVVSAQKAEDAAAHDLIAYELQALYDLASGNVSAQYISAKGTDGSRWYAAETLRLYLNTEVSKGRYDGKFGLTLCLRDRLQIDVKRQSVEIAGMKHKAYRLHAGEVAAKAKTLGFTVETEE